MGKGHLLSNLTTEIQYCEPQTGQNQLLSSCPSDFYMSMFPSLSFHIKKKCNKKTLGAVAPVFNSSTQEEEAGEYL